MKRLRYLALDTATADACVPAGRIPTARHPSGWRQTTAATPATIA